MAKIRGFTVFVCMLSLANAWGTPFKDDFNRPNGNVGNGWTIATTGTVTSQIVDNEVLVAGTTGAADWVRCGISRPVSGETRVSCDFKNDDVFNFHIQIRPPGSNAYVEVYCYTGGPLNYANSLDGNWPSAGWVAFNNAQTNAGQYNTIVLEQDGSVITVTLNGNVVGTVTNANFTTSIGNLFISSDASAGTTGSIHIDNVEIGVVIPGAAKEPSPAVGATDVPREVVLGWTPGEYAVQHDVYFGESVEDVNAASAANPGGVLVGPGRTDAAFDPEGLLEYGKTYYWRIDEVNGAPDYTVIRGDVWSFTAEPYAYTITGVTATASSSAEDMGPERTVDGSGLTGGQHSNTDTDMWLSALDQTLPAWIQYRFGRAYQLLDMTIWNSNQRMEPAIGFGAKSVVIEYSLDGESWSTLRTVEVPRAAGQNGQTGTTFDMTGAQARFVRLVIENAWGNIFSQAGLSEVRFTHIPVVARAPQPAHGADGISLEPALSWRPGREAVSHTVYFSDDKQAVAEGTAPAETMTTNSYQVDTLQYGTKYYWRVDEVNEAATITSREGDLWSFTTTDHFVVDDFESYDDDVDGGTTIWHTWIDGLTDGASGSQVGYDKAPFAMRTITNSGSQSMPFKYDNTLSPFYSQAYREFSPAWDWTANGVTDLVLYVRGYPAVGEVAVTEAGGKMTLTGAGADIWYASDEFTFAFKTLTGDGTMVARVVSNGTGSNTWAKGGVMIRDSLNGGSAHAMMAITGGGGNGAAFQYRMNTDGDSASSDSAGVLAPPYWVKIERVADTFTGYVSSNGNAWNPLGTSTSAMTSPVYIGIAVTSHEAGVDRTFQFEGIATTGSVSSTWQGAVISSPMHNSPQNFYVIVEDSTGKSAVANDPDVVTAGTWTEVRVPLSSFAGVNPAKVKRLYVGVGDRTNPTTGDSGTIYIDDIRVGCLVEKAYENLLANGGFEDGVVAPWAINTGTIEAVQTDPIEGQFCMQVTVAAAGANFWDVHIKHAGHTFQQGKKYTLSAFLKCDQGTRQINFKPELDADPWTGYGEQILTMTDEWAEYSITTPVFTQDVAPGSITFHVGFAAGVLWMDCVRFYEGDYVAPEL